MSSQEEINWREYLLFMRKEIERLETAHNELKERVENLEKRNQQAEED